MPKLFDSINIKNIKIKNRIVLPPLVRFSMVGKDGFVTDRVVEWYRDVCAGGTGLVIVEASAVAEDGKLRDNQLGIWDDKFIAGLKRIADICHEYEVPVLIQLHHAGFKEKIKDVSEHILDEILESFKRAFRRAREAGFDGIEIHGAHTYLISQLNSRLWNLRDDKYGGTFEKRMYFSKRLIEETRELFNDDFILGYRMGGNEPEVKDGIEIAKYLEKLGVDILHVSSGVPDPVFKQERKIEMPSEFPLDWVIYMGTEIKKHVDIPVIGVRKIKKETEASWLVENNLLDFVAVGRAMIARPNWGEAAKKEYEKRNGIKES
ncbi:NADH:flavin oxidoreductase [Fusobacterium ulcerans]|uniref:NADH:flavin oxidoreductase n=1 Tax=Fusobacterium ulcerans TaxID=861 RepID=UPI000E4BBEE7|nr:NADH:flavin oxidoreductase [Fusobacterium ulcerans]RGY64567.1 NADH:flavin oxidoreductase [Fusobacterium ulcerans]